MEQYGPLVQGSELVAAVELLERAYQLHRLGPELQHRLYKISFENEVRIPKPKDIKLGGSQ